MSPTDGLRRRLEEGPVIPGPEPGDRFLKLRFLRNAPSPKAVVVLRTRPGNR